jgi:integrase
MAKAGHYGELNWHKGACRWYKKLKNTDTGKHDFHYFGPKGKGPSDCACKKAAEAEWAEKKQELAFQTKIAKVHERTAAVEHGLIPVTGLGDTPAELNFIRELKANNMLRPDGYINDSVVEPDEATLAARKALYARAARKQPAASPRKKNISQHIDDWLAVEATKVGTDLEPQSLDDKEKGISTFRTWVKLDRFSKHIAEVDKMLMDYRAYLLRCMTDPSSKINSPWTVNDKLKFTRQFIESCWKSGVLKDMPRRLEDFSKKLPVQTGGKPIPLEDIKKLWDAAGPRMKCYMAIALNCGFKNGDITSLTGSKIQGKRLMGIRQKTKKRSPVPMNYALWPLTQKLIKQERDRTDDDELLFVNSKGGRITTGTFSQLFKKVATKAGVKATFEQLRDTSVDQVEQALLNQALDQTLLDVFLAHSEVKTSKHYKNNISAAKLKVPKLDEIVLGLEKKYGLTLGATSGKAPAKKKAPSKTKAKSPKPPKTPSHPELAHLRNK